MYVLDANIIILYVANDPEIVKLMESEILPSRNFCVPSVVVTEVYSKTLDIQTRTKMDLLFGFLSCYTIDYYTARKAGELRIAYKKLKTVDAMIAAATIALNGTLVTKNTRDFKMIEGLQLLP
jgi:predicted nucleic acid-binding protein